MRRVLVLILVAGLLAGCGLDGKSEADQLHELRVACLQGGGAWNASSSSCVERTPSTLTPEPTAATRIAFASNRYGDFDIYVMDGDGSNIRRLTDGSGRDFGPSWSPVP